MKLTPWRKPQLAERSDPLISVDQWIDMLTSFSYQNVRYTLPGAAQEEIGGTFRSLAQSAYAGNGVVFACMLTRMLLFSEARFAFRQRRSSGPGSLFGTPDLAPLEEPWPGGTTGDLLSKAIMDADLAGNAFFVRRPGRIRRLRPDWVTMILGSNEDADVAAWDVDADVIGYLYQPGGPGSGKDLVAFPADAVAHFAPIPDPQSQYRGMSWLTPIVREVMADKAATEHKLKFFENGATPNLVVKLDVPDLEQFQEWIDAFKENHDGAHNAYKTMFLGAGADATVVGANLQQLEFKVTQGAGETRIAAAAGVPPVIVGLSEGLQAATYSNYGQARRRFADGTIRPLWRNLAGSMARIVNVPKGAELWYDDRDIAFLQEDQKDAAEVSQMKATAIKTLVDAGYEPASVVDAVDAGDLTRLAHSGLVSVQLQPPGADTAPAATGANSARGLAALPAATDKE